MIEQQYEELHRAVDKLKNITEEAEKVVVGQRVEQLRDNLLVDAYGCSAHLLTLCGQDIGDASTISNVVTIVFRISISYKYFQNTHAPKSWLMDVGVPRPPLAGDTLWNSVADTLEWYFEHWGGLNQQMQIHGGDRIILRLLENIGLKRNAWDLLQLAKELGVNLDRVQRDRWNIAEACEIWLTLSTTDVIKNNATANKSVAARSATVFETGAFFAANLMDPRYNGKLLSAAQKRQAVEFIRKQVAMRYPESSDACVAGLMKLLAEGHPLPFIPNTKPSH